jgi:hypothetical protein
MTKRSKPVQLTLVHDSDVRAPTPLSRAVGRIRERRAAPAPKPWLCVVLAVDTARRSGWSVSVSGRRVDSGELDTLDEPAIDKVVLWAIDLAALQKLTAVLVLESPWGGNVAIVAALGQARERWRRAWCAAGQSSARIVKVTPSEWRGPVLGSKCVRMTRSEIREREQLIAHAMTGRIVGPDEAPAILICHWGSHAAAVGKAIGKRAQRASLKSWTTRTPEK